MKKTYGIFRRAGKGNSRARKVSGISEVLRRYLEGHRDEAMRFAVGLCRDEELAADLLQEACYRALKARRLYDASKPLNKWLFAILSNVLADRRRSAAWRLNVSIDRRPSWTEEDFHEILAHEEEPVLARLERKETSARLRIAVSRLTRDEREVLKLREFRGLSYAEVSRVLRTPSGTVRSRVFRARAKLRELVREYGLE